MVAYVLPSATDETAIRTGKRRALLARPRADNSKNPHVMPGARVHLRISGNREEPQRYLPSIRCDLNADVVFNKSGVQRILAAHIQGGAVEGVHALLTNAEQGSPHDRTEANDKLAAALGFTDYAALWADIGPKDPPFVARTVIGWGVLS